MVIFQAGQDYIGLKLVDVRGLIVAMVGCVCSLPWVRGSFWGGMALRVIRTPTTSVRRGSEHHFAIA